MPVRPWSPDDLGRPTDGTWADIAFGLGEMYEREDDLEQAAGLVPAGRRVRPRRRRAPPGAVLGRLADAGAAADSADDLLAGPPAGSAAPRPPPPRTPSS